jgi:MFS family permease
VKRISSTVVGVIFGGVIALLIFALLFRANSYSWVLYAFLIAVFAILFGLVGFVQAKNSPPSNQDSNRPKIIQFSLMRLLLVTSMVAFVFGVSRIWFDFKDSAEIFASSLIAFALGGITLICKKSDFKDIIVIIIIFISLVILIRACF